MLDYLTNWNKSIRYRSFFDQFIIKVNQTLDCFPRKKKKEIWNQRAISLPRKWKKILEKKRKKKKKPKSLDQLWVQPVVAIERQYHE